MKGVVFFGAGNISQSIIIGLINNGFEKKYINFIDRNPLNNKIIKKMGIKPIDIKQLTKNNHHIILAVKPKDAIQACNQIAIINNKPNLISLVAGIKIKTIKSAFKDPAIVRAMPITSSAYNKGITAIYGNPGSNDLIKYSKKIFDKVGISLLLEKEKEIDNFTGLIGSGPAYFFHILKVYEKRVLKLSNGDKQLTNKIISTFLDGISASVKDNVGFDEAIKKIASKKGTTEAGINSLISNNVLELFEKGILNAIKRSKEISDEY